MTSESRMWKAAERSGKAEDYVAYVQKYPQGEYCNLAKGELSDHVHSYLQSEAIFVGNKVDNAVKALEKAWDTNCVVDMRNCLMRMDSILTYVEKINKAVGIEIPESDLIPVKSYLRSMTEAVDSKINKVDENIEDMQRRRLDPSAEQKIKAKLEKFKIELEKFKNKHSL